MSLASAIHSVARILSVGSICWLPFVAVAAGVPAANRVALVIGNDSYVRVPRLSNARADAQAMAAALRETGFEVILRTDLDDRAMRAAMREFTSKLSGGSEAVFYFAGHGVQLGAANYLLPTNISADNEAQVRDDGLPLQRVLDDLTEQKVRFSVAIIDACRDNPFPKVGGRSIGATRGLASTTAATGQMILFSAGAGQTALDKLGSNDRDPNGLFTRVLLREIRQPGVPVDQVLKRTRQEVVRLAKSVGHEQVPALYDQTIGEFYFRPASAAAGVAAPASIAPAAVDPDAAERAAWVMVESAPSRESVQGYLDGVRTRQWRGLYVKEAAALMKRFASSPAAATVAPASARPAVAAVLPPSGKSFRDCPECPEMVVIPAGRFEMGANNTYASERPVHSVSIPSFALARTEVTVGEFRRFARAAAYRTEAEREGKCFVLSGGSWEDQAGRHWESPGFSQSDNHPVTCVTWNDAQAYAHWLARETGKPYRLPTEAEWEYAARGGTTTRWVWGEDPNGGCSHANTADATLKNANPKFPPGAATCSDGHRHTAPVGSFQPNGFGLLDMVGNLYEWTTDCWHDNYDGAPTDGSAWTIGGDCGRRVVRGGSWDFIPLVAGSASRNTFSTSDRWISIGFRPARTLP